MSRDPDLPPPMESMFINSVDTLWETEIPQRLPAEWNDRPPLFRQYHDRKEQQRRRLQFWKNHDEDATEKEKELNQKLPEENPILLKGVS